jgi:single-strand DNA-binding protein
VQRIIITGNLGRDPEIRTTQGGDQVCSLNVGVKQGWGDRASSNWYRCSVWGKRAQTVNDNLRKGQKVTVIGELTIGEYNGKPQYDVRVDDVDWQPSGERAASTGGAASRGRDGGGGGGFGGGGFGDDLDDNVPFATASFLTGLRAS